MRSSLGIILLAALFLGAGPRMAAADPPAKDDTGNRPCVDVQVGNERIPDFDCLNRQFRLQADRAHAAAAPAAPIDTHSSSIQVGTANTAAAQQMMGNAFGKSAQPQRPAQTFIPTLPRVGAH
jgi:hypothetical protein